MVWALSKLHNEDRFLRLLRPVGCTPDSESGVMLVSVFDRNSDRCANLIERFPHNRNIEPYLASEQVSPIYRRNRIAYIIVTNDQH